MKAKKFFISAISLGLLIILAGCEETAPTVPNQRGAQNTPVPSATNANNPAVTATSTASVNVLPGADVTNPMAAATSPQVATPTIASSAQISQADQTAYDAAQKLSDPAFCDKITDDAFMRTCKTNLLDLQAQNEAVKKLDPTLCAKLSTKDAQDACKINFDAQSAVSEKLSAEAKKKSEQADIYNAVFESGNFDQCNKITDQYYLDLCQKNAIMKKVLDKKDIRICQEFKNSADIAGCEKSYREIAALQEKNTQQTQ